MHQWRGLWISSYKRISILLWGSQDHTPSAYLRILSQPLDVCVFQPLKHWHSKAVNGCSSQYCYAWQQYLYHPQCTELDDVKQKILIGNRFKRCQFAVSSYCSRSSPLLTNGRPTAFERRLQASKSKQIKPKNEIQEKAIESLTISDKGKGTIERYFPISCSRVVQHTWH